MAAYIACVFYTAYINNEFKFMHKYDRLMPEASQMQSDASFDFCVWTNKIFQFGL